MNKKIKNSKHNKDGPAMTPPVIPLPYDNNTDECTKKAFVAWPDEEQPGEKDVQVPAGRTRNGGFVAYPAE